MANTESGVGMQAENLEFVVPPEYSGDAETTIRLLNKCRRCLYGKLEWQPYAKSMRELMESNMYEPVAQFPAARGFFAGLPYGLGVSVGNFDTWLIQMVQQYRDQCWVYRPTDVVLAAQLGVLACTINDRCGVFSDLVRISKIVHNSGADIHGHVTEATAEFVFNLARNRFGVYGSVMVQKAATWYAYWLLVLIAEEHRYIYAKGFGPSHVGRSWKVFALMQVLIYGWSPQRAFDATTGQNGVECYKIGDMKAALAKCGIVVDLVNQNQRMRSHRDTREAYQVMEYLTGRSRGKFSAFVPSLSDCPYRSVAENVGDAVWLQYVPGILSCNEVVAS